MALAFEYTWDKKSALELANKYKEHPNLWNPKHADYKNREMRHISMQKISDEMGVEKREIERKFKNLLSHYMRELKREAAKPTYHSKWFAYEALSYLQKRPHTEPVTRKRKVESDHSDEESEEEKDATLDSDPEGSFGTGPFLPHKIKKSNSIEDPLNEPILRPVDHATTSLINLKDDAAVFGEHIANKIRTMDQRTRAIVEYEINSTIFKAEMGYYCDRNIDLSGLTQT